MRGNQEEKIMAGLGTVVVHACNPSYLGSRERKMAFQAKKIVMILFQRTSLCELIIPVMWKAEERSYGKNGRPYLKNN
jgi:hypothetical protein